MIGTDKTAVGNQCHTEFSIRINMSPRIRGSCSSKGINLTAIGRQMTTLPLSCKPFDRMCADQFSKPLNKTPASSSSLFSSTASSSSRTATIIAAAATTTSLYHQRHHQNCSCLNPLYGGFLPSEGHHCIDHYINELIARSLQ